jgi:hypothetical protein
MESHVDAKGNAIASTGVNAPETMFPKLRMAARHGHGSPGMATLPCRIPELAGQE